MNMMVAMAAPDLRDEYQTQTKATQHGSIRTRTMAALDRARGVERHWKNTSVAARNLVLHDALVLLDPDMISENTDWNFFNQGSLSDRLIKIHQSFEIQKNNEDVIQRADDAIKLLESLVKKARCETYASFEEFQEAQKEFNSKKPTTEKHSSDNIEEDPLQAYELWLKQYRPYLVLGLDLKSEKTIETVEKELELRIKFFLEKNPEAVYQSKYTDRLWAYIYRVQSYLKP